MSAKAKKVAIDSNLLSIDLGYSGVKYYYKLDGKEVFGKIPTAVREINKDLEIDEALEFGDKKFLIGEDAIDDDVEITLDAKDLISNAPLFVYKVLNQENIDIDDLEVVTGLSIKDFGVDNKSVKELVKGLENFTINGEEINLIVKVLPQGRGIAFDFFKDKDEPKSTLIFDIGYNTFDFIHLQKKDGEETSKMMVETSFANDYGVNRIIDNMQGILFEELGIERSSSELNQAMIETRSIIHKGKEIDLTDIFSRATSSYLKDLKRFVMGSKAKSNLLLRANILLFGGGGAYMLKSLTSEQIEKIFERENIEFADEPYEFSNARGYYVRLLKE